MITCLMEINRTSGPPELLYGAVRGYRPCGGVCLLHAIASGRTAEMEAGQRVLREAARALRRLDRDLPIDARLEIGDAAERLLGVADEIQPELIVMSAHGEGDFPRVGAVGRVAREALERGCRPVLLVSPSGNKLSRPHGLGLRRRAGVCSSPPLPASRARASLQTVPTSL